MTKMWKIKAIGGVLLAILALGAAVVLAQEPEEAPFSDGDGVCDCSGEMPGNLLREGRRPGQRWSRMIDVRPGGFGCLDVVVNTILAGDLRRNGKPD